MTDVTEIRLIRRPTGIPVADDFRLVEVKLPALGVGQVEVENVFNSVDPYMRGQMDGNDTYTEAFALDKVMRGGAIGRVVASSSPSLSVGDIVEHDCGWRTGAVLAAEECRLLRPIDGVPLSAYLGVLGMPGWTAWVGLRRIAGFREGDRVFISAASGAVGSAAGQFASLMGASLVVGSVGSQAKAKLLIDEFHFDRAFDYRSGRVDEQLREAAPEGIDVYFDNVGGDHLEAAWSQLRVGGRVAVCGAISEYNGAPPSTVPRVIDAVIRRLSLRGFLVYDHADIRPEFERQASTWLAEGTLGHKETVFKGIEESVIALQSLFTGEKLGKVVVAINP
jgi:NADPH-dependent curcumin reductase CurA